jgi:hypothetical protein
MAHRSMKPGHALGGSVGPMGRTESVVDIQIGHFGQGPGKGLVVIRLSLMKAQVFQQQHLTLPKRRNGLLGSGPDTVVDKGHRLSQQRFQCTGTGF